MCLFVAHFAQLLASEHSFASINRVSPSHLLSKFFTPLEFLIRKDTSAFWPNDCNTMHTKL